MNLAVESRGAGPELVLLHGWGMHSGMWGEFADALARDYRVTCIDLPGHGRSGWAPGATGLASWSAACLAVVPGEAIWLGWSLGGLVALQAAVSAPSRVRGLVMLAATPRFVRADDWPSAVPLGTLGQFDAALRDDYHRTLERFLALQVRGSSEAHTTLRRLREALRARDEPNPDGLAVGLGLLRRSDLRALLPQLAVPSLWLFGERDTLVPAEAGEAILGMTARAVARCIAGAGHAPFLSHAGICVGHVRDFLERQDA